MVSGLRYSPGYLSQAEHDRLLSIVDALPWQDGLRRRVQHYGYRYDYTRKRVGTDLYLGALPDWAEALATRLCDEGCTPHPLDQVIVNEYLPGQGIAAHVDCVPCFADPVLSLSLGSACVMTLSRAEEAPVPILLEPGSLLVMSGDARYEWRHAIAARRTDRWDGRTITRARRVSLTFRTVLT